MNNNGTWVSRLIRRNKSSNTIKVTAPITIDVTSPCRDNVDDCPDDRISHTDHVCGGHIAFGKSHLFRRVEAKLADHFDDAIDRIGKRTERL